MAKNKSKKLGRVEAISQTQAMEWGRKKWKNYVIDKAVLASKQPKPRAGMTYYPVFEVYGHKKA